MTDRPDYGFAGPTVVLIAGDEAVYADDRPGLLVSCAPRPEDRAGYFDFMAYLFGRTLAADMAGRGVWS